MHRNYFNCLSPQNRHNLNEINENYDINLTTENNCKKHVTVNLHIGLQSNLELSKSHLFHSKICEK